MTTGFVFVLVIICVLIASDIFVGLIEHRNVYMKGYRKGRRDGYRRRRKNEDNVIEFNDVKKEP